MNKLLSTLLTIIFFQTSIFAFPLSFIAFNNYNSNSLKAIKNLPEQIKETYTATEKASNVETLKTLGYNIGDRVYDYKENPLLLVEDAASIITSYEMYKAGLNHKNIFYGSALIIGGITLDVLSLPTKAGKTIAKTAKATEKFANKEILKETKLFTDGAISKYPEAKLYQYNATTNPGPLAKMSNNLRENPINTFYGGYYNEKIAKRDIIVYRIGDNKQPYGQFFSYNNQISLPQGRIDLAIKPVWVNTESNYIATSNLNTVYKYKMPKGSIYYEGPINTQGGIHLGGLNSNQIFIPQQYQDINPLIMLEKKVIE